MKPNRLLTVVTVGSLAMGCAGRNAPPAPLGPAVSAQTKDAPFTAFYSPDLTTILSGTMDLEGSGEIENRQRSTTGLLRTVSGRIALASLLERDGAHGMQALTFPPEVIDAVTSGASLCTLSAKGAVICADLHRKSKTELTVEPDTQRLIALGSGLCAVRPSGEVSCYSSRFNEWKKDPGSDPRGYVAAAPVSGSACFITRDDKLVCMDSEHESWRVEAEGVVQASVGGGVGDFGGGCAVRRDGHVTCWTSGMNDLGTLGDGTRGPKGPTTVTGVTNAVAVARSAGHACALTSEHHVYCWGSADGYAFGDAALAQAKGFPLCARDEPSSPQCVSRSRFEPQQNHLVLTPVRVPELEGITSLAAGALQTCGVRTDGRLLCVGGERSGAWTLDLSPNALERH